MGSKQNLRNDDKSLIRVCTTLVVASCDMDEFVEHENGMDLRTPVMVLKGSAVRMSDFGSLNSLAQWMLLLNQYATRITLGENNGITFPIPRLTPCYSPQIRLTYAPRPCVTSRGS